MEKNRNYILKTGASSTIYLTQFNIKNKNLTKKLLYQELLTA